MSKLPDGLYDLLVTRAIQNEISHLESDRRAETRDLNPADSYVLLGRHVANIVREALRGFPEEERALRQTQICNEILRSVVSSLPEHVDTDDLIAEPPQRLAAVYHFDSLRSRRPADPEVPLS